MATIKIRKAMTMAPGMDKLKIDTFLSGSKTPLRLATTNAKGEPNIHPSGTTMLTIGSIS